MRKGLCRRDGRSLSIYDGWQLAHVSTFVLGQLRLHLPVQIVVVIHLVHPAVSLALNDLRCCVNVLPFDPLLLGSPCDGMQRLNLSYYGVTDPTTVQVALLNLNAGCSHRRLIPTHGS